MKAFRGGLLHSLPSFAPVALQSPLSLTGLSSQIQVSICRWNPAYGVAGASSLFIQLMDALYPINPNMLFLIQGPSQLNLTGVGGSSYVTNIPNAFIADNRDADPNPFFKQVLVKPYLSQVSHDASCFLHLTDIRRCCLSLYKLSTVFSQGSRSSSRGILSQDRLLKVAIVQDQYQI